jgi:rhodanese-related sulfurtransferase
MPTGIELDELQRLLANDAQLVEVLPCDEYEDMHLPGAVHLPLKELDRDTANGWIRGARWSSIAGTPSET